MSGQQLINMSNKYGCQINEKLTELLLNSKLKGISNCDISNSTYGKLKNLENQIVSTHFYSNLTNTFYRNITTRSTFM